MVLVQKWIQLFERIYYDVASQNVNRNVILPFL